MIKQLSIIPHMRIWLIISGILVVVSLIFLSIWGLKPGIDFTGGSLLEVRFQEIIPSQNDFKSVLDELNLDGGVIVQATEGNGYLIKFKSTDEDVHQQIISHLENKYNTEASPKNITEDRYESIGSTMGKEMREKAVYSIIFVIIAIILFIAYAFRKVSWPIKSWKYGVVAVVALIHDVILTLGLFAILGKFLNVEIDLPFVAALLTILGYSVNDTIVIFDRIRENLVRKSREDFKEIVNISINETLSRSINTMLTTLLALLAVFFFGGVTIKFFILALIFGIFFGTYSSIFIASPLLVLWEKYSHKK